MNYYPHHIGDFAAATAHLSMLEDAAYSRMIRWCYAEERPLPADLRAVCRIVRATTEAEREAVEIVLKEFFVLQDDGWHQKRIDAEIARYRAKAEKASRSASARWSAPGQKCERNANASTSDANACGSDANAMLTNSQEPIANSQKKSDSAAIAAAAVAAPAPTEVDPVKVLFDTGLELLTGAGTSEAAARRLIGLWRKEAGDDRVIGALQRAKALAVSDPKAWVAAALKPAASRAQSPLALPDNPNYSEEF